VDVCKVLIVCDHPLKASALKEIVEGVSLTEAMLLEEPDKSAFDQLPNVTIDVALVAMEEFDNQLDIISIINKTLPTSKIVVISDHISFYHMSELGLSGILPRKSKKNQITRMISTVMHGETIVPISSITQLYSPNDSMKVLTVHEQRILSFVLRKFTNMQIAKQLFVSTRTVENYLRRIYDKLGVRSRGECIEMMKRRNIHQSNL